MSTRRYIKTKDGKFAGSIGSGKTAVPSAAPTIPSIPTSVEPSSTPQMWPVPPAQRDCDDAVQQTIATIELLEAFHRSYSAADGSDSPDAQALKAVMTDTAMRLRNISEQARQSGFLHQAEAALTIEHTLMERLDQHDSDRSLLVNPEHINTHHRGQSPSQRVAACRSDCATRTPIEWLRSYLSDVSSRAVLKDFLPATNGDVDSAAVMASLSPNMWSPR